MEVLMPEYRLVGAKTYSTITRIFKQGVGYSAEEVGDLVEDVAIGGKPMFEMLESKDETLVDVGLVEVGEVVSPSTVESPTSGPRRMMLGKRQVKKVVAAPVVEVQDESTASDVVEI